MAVTLTKTISPRLASIIVGTKVNFGGKLAVESEKKRFSYRFIFTIMSAIMKLSVFALSSKSIDALNYRCDIKSNFCSRM